MNTLASPIADRAEPFNSGVAASAVLHVGLLAALLFGGSLASTSSEQFGTPNGNGAIRVKIASAASPGLLLPPRAPINPTVKPGDHPGDSPAPKVKPPKVPNSKTLPTKASPPRPANAGAVPILGPKVAPESAPMPTTPATTAPLAATPPIATFGNGGTSGIPGNGGTPAVTYGRKDNGTSATEIDFGEGGFGKNFGWYASRVTAAVAEQFDPPPGSPGRTAAVKFVIARDGTVSDVEFDRKSNIETLDNAAKRAILRAMAKKTIPPLPAEFRGASIHARLFFESRQ